MTTPPPPPPPPENPKYDHVVYSISVLRQQENFPELHVYAQ